MRKDFEPIVRTALREDRVERDITSLYLVDPDWNGIGTIVAKENGILCGNKCAELVIKILDPHSKIIHYKKDGQKIQSGEKVCVIHGKARAILSGERSALNFLQHLSGVATLTSRYVSAVQGTKAKIYDTRKTIPGLRTLQKYAVKCGGGMNHRLDLSEMAMVKDNHYCYLQDHFEKLLQFKKHLRKKKLILEAENWLHVQAALLCNPDILLLDNMPLSKLREAILLIRSHSQTHPQIEVSGGITLQNVRSIARLGVDRISIGALTHSAPAVDFSLEMETFSEQK